MNKITILISVFVVGLFFISALSENMQDIRYFDLSVKTQDIQVTGTVTPDLDFGKFPLYFIYNKGQVNEKAKYYAKASRYTLWMTKEGLVFDSFKKVKVKVEVEEGKETTHPAPSGHPSQEGSSQLPHLPNSPYSTYSPKLERDVSRLMFIGANKNPEMVPVDENKLRVNYFKGNDPAKWHCNVPTSQAVLYKGLYKNIQLKVYGVEKQIEYDWIVKPGGNPGDIRFEYKNVKGTRIDKDGNLLIETDFGELMHKSPVSYQEIGIENGAGSRVKVNVEFKKIGKNTYGFEVGEYDKNYELIIDPVVLVYSTYLGGPDEDYCYGIAVDNNGCAYVTGYTENTDFPILNQYQTYEGGEYQHDAFVTKIDTTQSGASSLMYSTYLGGEDWEEGCGIAVDSSGNAYVTGYTYSSDFPILNQYQTYPGGYGTDAFVTKIDTTQSGVSSLIYSTYLGGDQFDSGKGIAVDNNGNAYVTGHTGSIDFPCLNQYQTFPGGFANNAFVTKIDTTQSGVSSLIYSTYLGGSDGESGKGIAVDNNGNAYVTGHTDSTDFPYLNQYQAYQGGYGPDAFVTKIDTTRNGPSSLIYSTCLGGSNDDEGRGIAVDSSGNAYVTGSTYSSDFPILNQYQTFQGGEYCYDAFVTKIDTTRNGASSLIYSTYLGGIYDDIGGGIVVDNSGNAYVTGSTCSTDFPILNQYQTYQGSDDVFVTRIDTTQSGVSSLIYSTYLGGKHEDFGYGIAVDSSGNVYVTGCIIYSSDFPILNQYQTYQGDYDAFVTKLKMYSNGSPYIELNRTRIHFSAVIGESKTGSQKFLISNSGGGILNWSISDNASWLNCSPSSGTNAGSVTVSVEPTWLSTGTYTGEITVTDPNSENSPQTVSVTLNVYAPGASSVPFGQFATPIDGSTVCSSIAVTGWVLDDIGVKSVKIYRGNKGSLVYIGDAVFVEGARPDVEQAYPGYPMNYKAGWGYMMLTNFLPNGGNGTFKIHANAIDIEGNEITVGTKTIYCDNTNAVKPFGAIDTPIQGGTASGSNFINWGWVLTPQPNKIPTDGSTIKVLVDSVNIGNPTYNVYRVDIATLFPDYNNSNGAVGHFSLDTTAYTNGVHTISWTATDNGGNTDGIGSRYFTIQNTGEARTRSHAGAATGIQKKSSIRIEKLEDLPIDYSTPVRIRKRFVRDIEPEEIYPDNEGLIKIEIKELERLVIQLSESNVEMDLESSSIAHLTLNTQQPTAKNTPPYRFNGYLQVGSSLKSLPVGSSLDPARGVFYWQPGPGFIGKYRFVFIEKGQDMDICRKNIIVRILPKFE